MERQNSFENEQKLVKIDDFNSEEVKSVKEQVEERKRKSRAQAEKNKALRKKRKVEEKVDEVGPCTVLWKRLKNVNEECKKIKDATKRSEKCQKQYSNNCVNNLFE